MKKRFLLLILLLTVMLPWVANAQTVTIGTGTSTNNYLPGYTFYNYAISQQIYTAEEINASGNITSIAFYNAGTTTNSNRARKFDIYMAHTTKTGFEASTSTTKDWIALTDADIVYHGTQDVDFTPNTWTTFTLQTAFAYNGTDNLVVCVIDRSGDCTSSGTSANLYRVFSTGSEYQAIYKYGDGLSSLNPNGTNNTTVQDYSRVQQKNQIILGGIQQTCAKPTDLTATLDATDHTIATLSWTENGEATSWVLQYSEDNTFTTGVQSFNISGTPSKDLTGLTPEHKYYARVRPSCSETLWSDVCEFKPSATQIIPIGDGTSSGYELPVNTWYNYSLSQQIYTATEIQTAGGSAGTINSISFYHTYANTTPKTMNGIKVYLLNTDKEAFTSNTDMVAVTDADKVWEGNITLNGEGWVTIDFTTPFDYNGDNLIVCMYYPTKEYPGNTYKFRYTATTYYSSVYYYDDADSNIPDLNNINTYGGSKAYQKYHNNIQLGIIPTNTPKPKNLHVVDGSLWSGGATLAWEAPTSVTPTSYEWRYKSDATWTAWEPTTELSVALNLQASTHYTFQVKAIYDGVGESAAVETDFTTLDDCAFPTNLLAYTVPGQGTKATLTWVKGYDEENWVLQYGTDANFANGTYTEMTSGFIPQTDPGLENFVAAVLNGLIPETHYYARVKATCSATTSSTWSNVVDFTPTNYVDYTFGETPYSTVSSVPFYGYYASYGTLSQFIIPAEQLTDVAGGTIRRLTFYSSTATASWGDAVFEVYVKEVEASSFASADAEGLEDWTTMSNVYSGSLSIVDNQMVIELDNSFSYNGGNLMIGFNEATLGSGSSVSWRYVQGPSNSALYAYQTSSTGSLNYYRNVYLPRITFNYQPTLYQRITAINEGTITSNTAELIWTAPETTATIAGYYYQYKMTSAAEWPTVWHNLDANATSVTLGGDLIPGTSYDFRIKVLYEGNHESAITSTSFFTQCSVVTAFPWKEDFENYADGNFSHPCWVNEHLVSVSNRTDVFKVYTGTIGTNSTHQLQLPDMQDGNTVKLRLPEMNLPNANYQFVIDFYRNDDYYPSYVTEGISVFASTDGEIEGATLLAFIPRPHSTSNATGTTTIPQETEAGWYTYELPIGMSGTCFIILRGESRYGSSSYMDNFFVEEIPSCARPTDLAKSEVTNHSATIEWTAGDTEQTLWQIAYSKTTFDPNSASFDVNTVSTIEATSNPFTLDKILDAASTYYVYVRANCGTVTDPDYGPWSRKGISLTTSTANPAPSNFTASGIASVTVDLVWTAGGGDNETSWDLYYVKSATAPEAPTATTPATKTVTTLPTTSAPYQLTGLDPESRYYIWVRANHGTDGPSAWVALTGDFFETIAVCSVMDVTFENITHHNVTVNWNGESEDDFTVYYRAAAHIDGISADFTNGLPTDWTNGSGALNTTDGTATITNGGYWYFGTDCGVFDKHAYFNMYGTKNYWLITPNMTIGAGYDFSFDVAYTKYNSSGENNNPTTGGPHKLYVLISTDNQAHWTILREWNNTTSSYVLDNIPKTGQTINDIDISSYAGQTVNIAFLGVSSTTNYDNNIHIDNVAIGVPVAAGDYQTQLVEGNTTNITSLTAGTKYEVRVVPNCNPSLGTEWTSFTTMSNDVTYFTTTGDWATASNWMDEVMPTATSTATIQADANVTTDDAIAKNVLLEGTSVITVKNNGALTINGTVSNIGDGSIIVEDGGQLIHNNQLNATIKKSITAYTAKDSNGWYLIATPAYNTATSVVAQGTYDLFKYNEPAAYWYSNTGTTSPFNTLDRNTGYLYANAADIDLSFDGSLLGTNNEVSVNLSYTSTLTDDVRGFNLLGNPFTRNLVIGDMKIGETPVSTIYVITAEDRTKLTAVTTDEYEIKPCEGFFVQATATSQSLTLNPAAKDEFEFRYIKIVAGNENGSDNAYIQLENGNTLSKMNIANKTSVSVIDNGEDFAAATIHELAGSMPVNFKAVEDGNYTITVNAKNIEPNTMILVDAFTGEEVNLLETPNYSFKATTNDEENRFKIIFDCNTYTGIEENFTNEIFAYQYGSEIMVNGEGELQVFDVMGRMVLSTRINGVERINVPANAVYIFKLNEKVQKIVVR